MYKWILSLCLYLLMVSYALGQKKPFNDPAVTAVNTLPSHANFIPCQNGHAALNNDVTQRQLLLNGDWLFKMIVGKDQIPFDFFKPGFDCSKWDYLPVPSNWQRKGYGFPVFSNATLDMEPDEVGLYRHHFTIPENWKKGRTIIHFAGVKTAFHLYVNGQEVGYSEGAYLPSEFDITDFLKKGQNLLAVAVYRVADIQKIENFDTWRLSGIFRDVILTHRPDTYIEDFEVKSPAVNNYKDGQWAVTTRIRNKSKKQVKDLQLLLQLYTKKNKQLVAEKILDIPTIAPGKSEIVEFSKTISDVALWNAETPNLYTSVFELRHKQHALEGMAVNTGFRTIEVIDEQIKINGKKIS